MSECLTADGPRSYTRTVESWILEVFLEAVRQVLREVDVPVDSVGRARPPGTADGIIASVGFTGDLRGHLHAPRGPPERGAAFCAP